MPYHIFLVCESHPYPPHSTELPCVTDPVLKESYLMCNKPCILTPSLTKDWPCFQFWTQFNEPSMEPSPAWDYLAKVYGCQGVTVADCRTRHFSDQKRCETTVAEAIRQFQFTPNSGAERPLYYIKDWHLIQQSRDDLSMTSWDRQPYSTPDLFRDDCKWKLMHSSDELD